MTGEEFMTQWLDDSPYIEAHTSGSTGKPKDIRLLKSDMLQSASATNTFFGIGPDSLLASPLSPDYIAGKMMYVRAFAAGCRMVQLPVSNDIEFPEANGACTPAGFTMALDRPVTLLPVVPSQLQSLIAQPHLSARIANVLIGGAAPSAAQCRALAKAGYRAFVSYGMTETCSHVALAPADGCQHPFRAMPGISFDTDTDGRLIINAPAFSFGRLITTDIVDLHDEYTFTWRGRADGVINSGGIKLFPEELESEYIRILGAVLAESNEPVLLVRGIPHPVWGEAVELLIEAPEQSVAGADACRRLIDAIESILREAIPDHRRLPKRITVVATLPRTSTGKLRRR